MEDFPTWETKELLSPIISSPHCVCFLDNFRQPMEAFIGLSELTQTTADAIHFHIETLFKKINVNIGKMVSCSFDGGANYSGCWGGVQALLRKDNPSLFYVYCRAHLLQLALVHASQKYQKIKSVISLINSL